MMKPPLKAATNDTAWAGSMGAVNWKGPPPGLNEPEYSCAERTLVSIHAIPAGWVPPGGTRSVSYTAGSPFTVRPTGVQAPSPAAAGWVNGASAVGAGRFGTVVVVVGGMVVGAPVGRPLFAGGCTALGAVPPPHAEATSEKQTSAGVTRVHRARITGRKALSGSSPYPGCTATRLWWDRAAPRPCSAKVERGRVHLVSGSRWGHSCKRTVRGARWPRWTYRLP